MLEELLKEINELKQYKERYEFAIKDKKEMSQLLYEYMMKDYKNTTKEERVAQYKKECCSCCRYDCYDCDFPDDIMKPVPSEDAWIPSRVSCGKFRWA